MKKLNPSIFTTTNYSIKNEKYFFFEMKEETYNENWLNKIKSALKKNARFYQFLINVFSPVLLFYTNRQIKQFLKDNLKSDSSTVALNIGSGNSFISDKVQNIDIFPYDNVNIVCDIENLPFQDNSVDIILNIAVLEHVPNPEKVVNEIHRVLKKGGKVFSLFPFIQGFHASPHDYTRRTVNGMKVLYKDFDIVSVKSSGGPTSGFLWITQEWLAIILSFGIKPLYKFIHLILMLLTFPIKYLDLLLIFHPAASNISTSFTLIGEKK